MPASNLLAVALVAALQPPAGFETVPIDGKTQVMVARKGDVYFVVRDLPGVLSAKAKPRQVAAQLITEASEGLGAEWIQVRGVDVIGFTWGDDKLGAQGLIGAHGAKTRVATCQWGVGLKPSPPAERKASIDACTLALTHLEGVEAPPAASAESPAEQVASMTRPFKAPDGFEWRSDGAGGWLGVRGGDADKGGGEALGGYELPIAFDTRMELSRVTDEVSEVMPPGVKLEALDVVKLPAAETIHFTGRVGTGPAAAAVEGFLLPRGRTSFLVFVLKQGAVPPELSTALRGAAESVEGVSAPAVDSKPAAAPDAGPPGPAAGAKKPPAKKGGDEWKGAAVVGAMAVVAIVLSVAMGLGRSRRRRRREAAPPDGPASA